MSLAATLTKRVLIRQRSAGYDAAGQPTETFIDLSSIWADVRFMTGSEYARANQEVNKVQISLRTRKRSDITPSMVAVYQGQVYNIVSVLPQSAFVMDISAELV